mgnify:CR=1 FL=1
MPAYSFKEQFVPFIIDGTKPHTIRARRNKGFAKEGSILYLYYGLRTKWCKKLREEICTKVQTIIISETDIWLCPDRLNDEDAQSMIDLFSEGTDISFHAKKLTRKEADLLAWKDGFRQEPTGVSSIGNFEIMLKFWKDTHQLPFIGDFIQWCPKIK